MGAGRCSHPAIFGEGDAADLSPATITAGSAAVFLAVLVVAVATVIATVPIPRTPVLAKAEE